MTITNRFCQTIFTNWEEAENMIYDKVEWWKVDVGNPDQLMRIRQASIKGE